MVRPTASTAAASGIVRSSGVIGRRRSSWFADACSKACVVVIPLLCAFDHPNATPFDPRVVATRVVTSLTTRGGLDRASVPRSLTLHACLHRGSAPPVCPSAAKAYVAGFAKRVAGVKWSERERARAATVVQSRLAARGDSTAAVRRLLRLDGHSVSPVRWRTVVGSRSPAGLEMASSRLQAPS